MDEQDDPNLITIGELQVQRKRRLDRFNKQECPHQRIDLNDHGETVRCQDCGVFVSAYWALCHWSQQINDGLRSIKAQREQLAWERKKLIRRVAVRKVEEAWNRGMLPVCPHCHAGILPEDGFGGSQVCKELELARRAHVAGEG